MADDCRECKHLRAKGNTLYCNADKEELYSEDVDKYSCDNFEQFRNAPAIKPIQDRIIDTCEDIKNILIRKNKDYGNSFETTLNKYGDVALLLRLEDKMNRLESLFNKKENLVKDESFNDTVTDLAGYCLLYLALRGEGSEK